MLFCFLLFFLVLAPSTIITSSQTHPELLVLCPSEANEDSVFLVTIKSGTIFITNATVTFNGETTLTNATGKVTFQAPRVVPDVNNTFTITASKEGYNTMSCFITILNVPQLFPTIPSTYLTEYTTFVVTVVDEQGRPIKNATITYENKEYQTLMKTELLRYAHPWCERARLTKSLQVNQDTFQICSRLLCLRDHLKRISWDFSSFWLCVVVL